MGLCKLKDQINYGPKGSFKEREKDHMVKNKKDGRRIFEVSKGKKKSSVKKIFEPIKCCKHPLIASRATPIKSAGRAPDEIKTRRRIWKDEKTISLSLYSKIFDYSLGG
jgi:hypothetical protein